MYTRAARFSLEEVNGMRMLLRVSIAASGDEQEEGCRREAATQRESCYDTCRRPARSHAASFQPSIDSKSHAYRSQKAPTSLIS
jgi:hypothetical protein